VFFAALTVLRCSSVHVLFVLYQFPFERITERSASSGSVAGKTEHPHISAKTGLVTTFVDLCSHLSC